VYRRDFGGIKYKNYRPFKFKTSIISVLRPICGAPIKKVSQLFSLKYIATLGIYCIAIYNIIEGISSSSNVQAAISAARKFADELVLSIACQRGVYVAGPWPLHLMCRLFKHGYRLLGAKVRSGRRLLVTMFLMLTRTSITGLSRCHHRRHEYAARTCGHSSVCRV
jgi:hypothetical protein